MTNLIIFSLTFIVCLILGKCHTILDYEESETVNYLRAFGYIKNEVRSHNFLSENKKISHEKFTEALKEFQVFF